LPFWQCFSDKICNCVANERFALTFNALPFSESAMDTTLPFGHFFAQTQLRRPVKLIPLDSTGNEIDAIAMRWIDYGSRCSGLKVNCQKSLLAGKLGAYFAWDRSHCRFSARTTSDGEITTSNVFFTDDSLHPHEAIPVVFRV
jgi:hypothetical protein